MDFDIPQDLADYLASSTTSSSGRSSRSSRRTTTSASSTTAARTPAPTGTAAACRTRSGRSCSREARAPRRRRRPLPLPVPEGVRRQGRHQPRHGGHPRAPRAQGPRPAQRPAERALDRRQQRRPAADDRLRHRRAEGGVGRRPRRRAGGASPSASPSPTTAPTPRTWRPTAVRDGDEWVINGEKTWNTGIHKAQYDLIFARTSGKAGDGDGITAFLVPTDSPGFEIVEFLWTFNMPTDHAHIRFTDVRVPDTRDLRRRGPGPAGRAALLQREPHPPGRVEPRRRAVLHRRVGRVRQGAQAVRQAAGDEPGDPVPARRAADAVRDAARADPQDGVGDGHVRRVLRVRQGVDVQLLGQPAVLRGGRPGDAGARRARLLAATSRSSTSTATTAATASPRAPRRSRCAASPATCSAS